MSQQFSPLDSIRTEDNYYNNMTVLISPNLKKQSDRIDPMGNIIDKRTKQILEPVTTDDVTPQEIKNAMQNVRQDMPQNVTESLVTNPLSIQEEIDETKKRLALLEEKKKAQIEEMKKQLAILES